MANIVNVSIGGQSVPVKVSGGQTVHPSTAGGSVHISPGSAVIIGKSPYINPDTGTWMVYDDKTKDYIDSGVVAEGSFPEVSEEFIIDENDVLHIYEVSASKIDGLDALLGIQGISIDGVLLPEVNKIVDLPMATAESLGLVRSSSGENAVYVDMDGTMMVDSLNVNRLTQTPGERFTLNAGDSTE